MWRVLGTYEHHSTGDLTRSRDKNTLVCKTSAYPLNYGRLSVDRLSDFLDPRLMHWQKMQFIASDGDHHLAATLELVVVSDVFWTRKLPFGGKCGCYVDSAHILVIEKSKLA